MVAQLPLHEWMGMPKYLLDEHVNLIADEDEPPWRPHYRDAELNHFYQNDLHITGATLQLHPLLDSAAVNAILELLGGIEEVGTLFELDKRRPEARVHLVIAGRLRLVAYPDGGKPVEIGQCRPGQWLGMPSALREFDERTEEALWSRPSKVVIKAIPLGKVSTQSVLVTDLVAAMRRHETLLRFVRQHVSIRFARRNEILARMRESAILRLLPPADQEYLMQLGVLRRTPKQYEPGTPSVRYLSAGKPSGRVALVLAGKCTAFLPGENDGVERFVGKFGIADLIGHEAIVMPDEVSGDDDFEIHEAPRATNVCVGFGAELLEFFWYAFRWTLDDRMSTWKRIVTKMMTTRHAAAVPEIVSVQASRPHLGTSALAQGLAVSLASLVQGKVCIVDLQGAHRFENYFRPRGFGARPVMQPLQAATRAKRSGGRDKVDVHYFQLVPPESGTSGYHWPPSVEMVWPKDTKSAGDTENLVELLLNRDELRYVIVCMRQDAENADAAARDLAVLLNSRSATVLYVTDETEAGYRFSDVEPPRLVWVERMTPEYMKRERVRMQQAMNQARYGEYLPLLPPALRDQVTRAMGGLPDATANTDFEHRRQIVRVRDDLEGAKLLDTEGPHALVGPGSPDLPLKRALARLARVVTRRTVGLALGGGGAWGYCHLALIQNLEEQGVPIDYITGASFGSIVGGLYAAGGRAALERLIEENSLDAQNPLSPLIAPLTSPLMRTVMFAAFSAATIEWFVDAQLRRMGLNHGEPIGLGTTEIPFYPVSSNLTTYRERTEEHSTVGHGVRLSGTMPPVAPAFRLNGELIVDGAFVANVPSRYLREIGADFVIASNAVPPAPAESPEGGTLGSVVKFVMTRFNDALRANQLLTWKAGEDQANLHADYRCDMRPSNANVFDMWKGRAIMEQIRRDHFSGAKATSIRDAWQKFCDDPFSRREHAEEPDAGDGAIREVRTGRRM